MRDGSIANCPSAFSLTLATNSAVVRPAAARTKLSLEGPVLSTLLRLSTLYGLDLGAIGVFAGIAGGFCAYAALTSAAILKVEGPQPRH